MSSKSAPAKLIDWLLSIPFLLAFSLLMLTFDILMKITPNKRAKRALELSLEKLALQALKITGATFTWHGTENIPKAGPCLIVSNHQSLFDIPLIEIPTAHLLPHFISKQELAKWIPSVSVMLRENGHYLIDRKKGLEAKKTISFAAEDCKKTLGSLVIFPEGTRARDGVMHPMKSGGFQTFIEICPEAKILPVSISQSWRLTLNKLMPVPRGIEIIVTFHPIASPQTNQLFQIVENLIKSEAC